MAEGRRLRTPEHVHERLTRSASERGVPAPPRRPVTGECCQRGCDPCVWDYYERALSRWREAHEAPGSTDAAAD